MNPSLYLQVISADNLAKKDIFGASDPYVRIDLVTPCAWVGGWGAWVGGWVGGRPQTSGSLNLHAAAG